MSKVGGALPAWYWPDGIPRRSPVAHQTLDRLIKRAAGRAGDRPAIVWPGRSLSHAQLLDEALAMGRAVAELCEGEAVGIAEADPGEAYVLMLAVLAARRRAVLLDPALGPEALASRLADAGAEVVLTATGAAGLDGLRVIDAQRLREHDGEAVEPRAVKATDPAIVIPAGDELAMHSQYSVAAMAISLSAFVPRLREMALVAPPPLWRWEALAVMTAALTGGGPPVFVCGLADLGGSVEADGAYAVLLRRQADELVGGARAPAGLRALGHLFVSTGWFRPRWRRELEAACGREVLPIWGTAPLGPAVAAHPSWFPLDAHGIPLVNVRVVPVDPATGEVSVVPWEMLERAEIGVESPAAMARFVRDGADADLRAGNILRTFQSGSVDHVGVVVLDRPRGDGEGLLG